jgi:hypothetical protein
MTFANAPVELHDAHARAWQAVHHVLPFLRAGFGLVEIPFGAKAPRQPGWQRREAAIFGAANAHHFKGANAGILHEWSRTCAIDIDDHDSADTWLTPRGVNIEALFCADDAVSVSSGRPNHGKLLYRLPHSVEPPATIKIKSGDARVILEFRCAGSQDVIGGRHPEGPDYTVRGDPATMPTLPDTLWELWRAQATRPKAAVEKRVNTGLRFASGGRNDALTREAGKLRHLGYSAETIEATLQQMNVERCDPPLEQAEVESISRSVSRYAPGDGQAEGEDCEAVSIVLSDFYSYMPMHQYIFVPTRELWPSVSVDGRIRPWPKTPVAEKDQKPSLWLDANRPIEQMTWQPGEPMVIKDKVIQSAGWIRHDGATVFNLYRGPAEIAGDAQKAGPWLDHVHKAYPDDAEHVIRWLAHRIQRPGEKVNHAIVLSGAQGIGKDTLLEPIKAGVGPWNWQEISPTQMLGRFNGWAKAVVVRVSEARDLGEVDRFVFYDHCKVYVAAPPDVLRVDEKHLREHYVANILGVVITTNHADGLYLPADDRRHYVAWSSLTQNDFPEEYWKALWGWYQQGGTGHVVAYLRRLDISAVDWKAPPRKTAAFWNVAATGEAPESGELRDVIEAMGNPAAFATYKLINEARLMGMHELADELADRKNRRSMPHKLERVGYVPARNPDADDGLFKIGGKRAAVYAMRTLPVNEQIRAARKIS